MQPGKRTTLPQGRGRTGALASAVPPLALLALLTLSGKPARASEQPPDPDLATTEMRHAGPFYIQPLFVLKDVGYDDNIRFEAQTAEGDTTATVGGALGALLLGGSRGGLRFFGEADYVTFGKNTDLNHWNGDSRGRGILVLKRALLSLEDHFSSLLERPTSEIDERIRRENNAITAAFQSRNVGRLGVRGYLRREGIDYSSGDPALGDLGHLLNRDENTLAVVGEVRVLPKTTFTLETNVKRIDFLDTALGRDNRSRSILPGFRFDPSASVQGEFKLGPMSFEAPDQTENRFHGTVGEGHLITRLGHSARRGPDGVSPVRELHFGVGTTVPDLVRAIAPAAARYVGILDCYYINVNITATLR